MSARNEQENFWADDFGENYIGRNIEAWRINGCMEFFSEVLAHTEKGSVRSICEFGANAGNNLLALRRIDKDVRLFAVEINKNAFDFMNTRDIGLEDSQNSSILECTYSDASFDLTFTSGVLIHINPEALADNIRKVASCSRRYVMINEYFSHQPVEVPYRGHTGRLFKRDFGSFCLDNVPNLSVVSYGFVWMRQNPSFDNTNWWLFEKKKPS